MAGTSGGCVSESPEGPQQHADREGGQRGQEEAGPDRGRTELEHHAVDVSPDPSIFAAFDRRRRASLLTGHRDHVFTDSLGRPLSQEWLAKRVWNPTIRRIGLAHRGQYNIRDTFITMALSAGEDPGWVAEACGTSEEMIWRHYRKWIPGQKRDHGQRIAAALVAVRARDMPAGRPSASKSQRNPRVESGGGGNRKPLRGADSRKN